MLAEKVPQGNQWIPFNFDNYHLVSVPQGANKHTIAHASIALSFPSISFPWGAVIIIKAITTPYIIAKIIPLKTKESLWSAFFYGVGKSANNKSWIFFPITYPADAIAKPITIYVKAVKTW